MVREVGRVALDEEEHDVHVPVRAAWEEEGRQASCSKTVEDLLRQHLHLWRAELPASSVLSTKAACVAEETSSLTHSSSPYLAAASSSDTASASVAAAGAATSVVVTSVAAAAASVAAGVVAMA